MKYFTIALLAIVFTGCNPMQKAKQQAACNNHDGVYKYGMVTTLTCKDGTRVSDNVWWNMSGPAVAKALKDLK